MLNILLFALSSGSGSIHFLTISQRRLKKANGLSSGFWQTSYSLEAFFSFGASCWIPERITYWYCFTNSQPLPVFGSPSESLLIGTNASTSSQGNLCLASAWVFCRSILLSPAVRMVLNKAHMSAQLGLWVIILLANNWCIPCGLSL